MSETGSAPADVLAELDAELEQVIQEADAAVKATNAEAKATVPAIAYANDHGVDLKGMKGSGKDGNITVMDVEKAFKVQQEKVSKEAEAAAKESDKSDAPEATSEKPPAKAKTKKAAVRKKSATASPLLPTLRQGLSEVKHLKRTLNRYGMGWENEIVSGDEANEKIGEYLTDDWILVHMQGLGVTTDGLQFLWIVGKPVEGDARDWPYREIHHILQNVGTAGADGQGIAGFQADSLINSYLDEGWELAYVQAVGVSPAGLNMLWVLIR